MGLFANRKSILAFALILSLAGLALWGPWQPLKRSEASCDFLIWGRFKNQEIKFEQELWEEPELKCSAEHVEEIAKKHCDAFRDDSEFLGVSAYLQVRKPKQAEYKTVLSRANVCVNETLQTPQHGKTLSAQRGQRAWQKIFFTDFENKSQPHGDIEERNFNISDYSLSPQGKVVNGPIRVSIFNTGWIYLENAEKKISRWVYVPDVQWNQKAEALIDGDRVVIFTRFGQFYAFDSNFSLARMIVSHTKVCGDSKFSGDLLTTCLTDTHGDKDYSLQYDLRSGDLIQIR